MQQNTVVRNTLALFGFLVLIGLAIWVAFTFYPENREGPDDHLVFSVPQHLTAPGGISFTYDSGYSVAIVPEQILVRSYIPPCDSNFNYCFYRTGNDYEGTTFESAGLRVMQRNDLRTKTSCLSKPPAGYSTLTPKMGAGGGYATSVFGPLSEAATGHHATGSVYRLFFGSTCFEFETRIGESEYANYSLGSIKKFTLSDREAVSAELSRLLSSITIVSLDTQPQFPAE